MEKYPLARVGNYLVATPLAQKDEIFGGSIIKITRYNPLVKHVTGTGIIKGHPSYGYPAGWGLDKLLHELDLGFWNMMEEHDMRKYACIKGVTFG